MAALLDDEEYAEVIIAAQARDEAAGEKPRRHPSIATWSPELNALADLNDKLSVLIALSSTDSRKPVPYDRPKTKVEILKAQRDEAARWAHHESIVARVIRKPVEGH